MNDIIKVLPMKYPEITSYPFHANLFSILSNYEKAMPWLYNYYIQLEMGSWVKSEARLDFCVGWPVGHLKNCPWLNYTQFGRDYINKRYKSITEFLVESINLNYYIYLDVDQFNIPYYRNYQKKHCSHDMFIFGYDMGKKIFYIADFFENLIYKFRSCTFEEVEKGYIGIESLKLKCLLDNIILLSFKDSGIYNFDIKLVANLIDDYLNSKNSNHRYRLIDTRLYDGFVYGIEIYELLKKHLGLIMEENIDLDLIGFHVLWDHKKNIQSLIKYLGKSGYLTNSNDFYRTYKKKVESLVLLLRNIVIKYSLTGNKTTLLRAQAFISEIKINESDILQNILLHINKLPKIAVHSNSNIDNFNFDIIYIGVWKNTKKSNLDFGTASYTDEMKSSAEFLFFGSSITYIASKNKYCGYVDIYIDNIKYSNKDLYSDHEKFNEEILTINNLSIGYHIIKVVCIRKKCEESYGFNVSVNGFKCNIDERKDMVVNDAQFLKFDMETKGSWKNAYGLEGYDIISSAQVLPPYARLQYSGAKKFPWIFNNTDDVRALQNPNRIDQRIITCLYNEDGYNIELIVSGDIFKRFSLYLVDFDEMGRTTQIEAIDADSGKVLDNKILIDLKEGIYVTYLVKGHISFNIKNLSECPAVVSGIFFE